MAHTLTILRVTPVNPPAPFVGGGFSMLYAQYVDAANPAANASCFAVSADRVGELLPRREDWMVAGRDETSPTWAFDQWATAMNARVANAAFFTITASFGSIAAMVTATGYRQFGDYLERIGNPMAAASIGPSPDRETWVHFNKNDWETGNAGAAPSVSDKRVVSGIESAGAGREFPATNDRCFNQFVIPIHFDVITCHYSVYQAIGAVPSNFQFKMGIKALNDQADPIAPPTVTTNGPVVNVTALNQHRQASQLVNIQVITPPIVVGMAATFMVERIDAAATDPRIFHLALRCQRL